MTIPPDSTEPCPDYVAVAQQLTTLLAGHGITAYQASVLLASIAGQLSAKVHGSSPHELVDVLYKNFQAAGGTVEFTG